MSGVAVVACSFFPEVGPLRDDGTPADEATSSGSPATSSGSSGSSGSTGSVGTPDGSADLPVGDGGDGSDAGPKTWTVIAGPKDDEVFSPRTITIRAGDEVRWLFEVSGHNVIGANGQFCAPNDTNCGSAPEMPKGAIYTRKFPVPGTFNYYCGPHEDDNMRGTVIVK